MTYIGMVIDRNVAYEAADITDEWERHYVRTGNYGFYMSDRIRSHKTWPGQKISDDTTCKVC